MFKRNHSRRALAMGMAVWMAAVCVVPSMAAPIDSGVSSTYDEAYYATLDYYGNLVEGSVVKSYSLNGASSVTDYGAYDQVVNLTDGTPANLSEGSAAFQFDQSPGHFYFEGKTAQPFQDLPWTVNLRYYLNGVPARAEDLAGEKGVVEIEMDLIPNPNASDYARYNYTLEAMALFNEDDILSMEAPGAQVQLVGNLRTALFMALPGEEEHFTIRVGSNDFSFSGMTILMVPATLSQLEEIAKLSQRKDELEEDYRALSGSLDAMLDALNDIQGGLYDSADGLDRLNQARATISAGKGTIYGDVDTLRGDLSNIADALGPVQQRTQTFSQAVTEAKGVLGNMTDTALTLKGQLDGLDAALKKLEDGTGDVKDLMTRTAALEGSLHKLEQELNEVELKTRIKIQTIRPVDVDIDLPSIGSGGIDGNGGTAAGLVAKVEQVHGAYEAARGGDRAAAFTALLVLQGKSEAEAAEMARQADQLADAPDVETAVLAVNQQVVQQVLAGAGITAEQLEALPDDDPQKIAILNQISTIQKEKEAQVRAQFPDVQKLNGLRQIAQTQTFQVFCENLPGVSKSQAKQMADLWTIKAGGAAAASFGLLPGAMAGSMLLPGGVITAAAEAEVPPQTDGTLPQTDSAPPQADGAAADPAVPADPPAGASGDQTVGGAAVDIIASGLDDMTRRLDKTLKSVSSCVEQTINDSMDDLVGSINRSLRNMNGQLDDLQDELDGTLKDLTRPTAAVVGELADVCARLDELTYLLDDAADVSAAVREFSPAIKGLLDQVDSLRTVMDSYEPTLQAALANAGALSGHAAVSLRDLESLLADTESLMQTSGEQLDSGTQQTLRGLSQSLRKTGRALSTTSNVKDAKNALGDIIEDTWHEYTGDVNNILMMDAGAQPVSLTDRRNPAPSSVQVLLRTQEIKQPETEAEAVTLSAAPAQGPSSFWGRVVQMFRDFWAAITGIFH